MERIERSNVERERERSYFNVKQRRRNERNGEKENGRR